MIPHTILQTLVAAGESFATALTVKATVAMLVGLAVLGLARGASASLRHLMAAATFGALLLLPLAALLAPPRVVAVATRTATAPPEPSPRRDVRATAPTLSIPRLATPTPRFRGADAAAAAYGIYLLGAAWLGASLLLGVWRLRGVGRRAEVSVAGTRLANEMARAEGGRGGIEVVVSSEMAVPMTFGWRHPVILLPAETAEWSEPELVRALRHELEHVRRGDWATHIVSRVALALYWPHPFTWVLWRRLRLEAEQACDDAVIRSHGQAEGYAEQLVSLARNLRGHGTVPALSMATRSNLGRRVEAILDGERRREPRSLLTSLAVGAAVVAGVLALAPFRVSAAATPQGVKPAVPSDDGSDEADDAADSDDADPRDVALLEAAEKGALPRMQRLLDQGARANAAIDGDGSPLIAAARRGRVEAMRMLIGAGADVNRGVQGDGSPLIASARGGHLEAVRLLLDRGADVDLGVSGDGNPLIMAAGAGQLEMVRFLLDQGAALEKVVPGDENALIHASESGQTEVVRLLLARGADVNARVWADGSNGGRGEWRTAMGMARRNGHAGVVEALRAAGARE